MIFRAGKGLSGGSDGKESACNTGDPGSTPGSGRSSGDTISSILDWTIPCREKPGGLQTTGLQRVGHNSVTNTYFFKVKNYTFRQ